MSARFETDVLVVGTGPAGGAMALALATYGVDVTAINVFPRHVRTPRAHITNQRCMEVLRDLGVEGRVMLEATPRHLMGNNVFCTSIAGEEIGRLRSWQTHPLSAAEAELASPTEICDMPQDLMEPILTQGATQRGARVRWSTEYLSHVQDDEGVTVTVLDRLTGEEYEVRCRYLYGADGANSKVAEDAGLPFDGEMGVGGSMNIVFHADLSEWVAHRPSVLYWVLQPGADVGGIGMGLVRMVRPWDKWLIVWGYDIEQGAPEVDDEFATGIVRQLVGVPDLDVTIDSTSVWTVNRMWGTRNTEGRVFCGGDSMHRHPPSNGLGSNTSMQDSFNLAWKLAMVLRGEAGPGLLASYDAERIPIAEQVVTRANQSIDEFGPIFEALGMTEQGVSTETLTENMAIRKEDSPRGRAVREALRKAVDLKHYEFNAHGVDMNHRYVSDAVVVEPGDEPPVVDRDPELHAITTSFPGHKVPHAWFRSGPHGEEVLATLDLVGHGRFTLLTGISGGAWEQATERVADELGIELATVVEGPGRDVEAVHTDWAGLRGVSESGCLLVRPDGYVAWRAAELPDDPTEALGSVLRQVLDR